MQRIIEPLKKMGVQITGSRKNTLPLLLKPAFNQNAIKYELQIASAQVKSAIIFTGLQIEDKTEVIETRITRNHTENLLDLDVKKTQGKIISSVSLKDYPDAKEYFIPGDISSAMYFIVIALLTKNSELQITNVSLNETRIAAIELLLKMGAKIELVIKGDSQREKYGDLIVKSSELQNVQIKNEIIPLIIDEIPILAVAGLFAEGEFKINNALELRVKESDRIKSLCDNISSLGVEVKEFNDGFSCSGAIKISNPAFKSFHDHRIAMAFSILSCLLDDGGSVDGFESAAISNPDFLHQLKNIINH